MRVTALIERIAAHSNGTQRIDLRLDPADAAFFSFRAGQYLAVVDSDGAMIPFSIASSPTRLPAIELHFHPVPDSADAEAMLRLLEGKHLTLDGPHGDVTVEATWPRPLALIVAGSGAAQASSIVEYLARVEQRMPVHLYWHVTDEGALYRDDTFRALAVANGWFHYRPLVGVLAGASTDAGRVHDWLARERAALEAADVVLCGSPDFVYALADSLRALQIAVHSVRSDVFAYAPR